VVVDDSHDLWSVADDKDSRCGIASCNLSNRNSVLAGAVQQLVGPIDRLGHTVDGHHAEAFMEGVGQESSFLEDIREGLLILY